MKIAVIGKGNIGGTLGSRWRAAGHDVVFGARDGSGEGPGGALLAAAAPSAKYVRAFNSLGWENFADPVPGANLFFAADPEARATAEELISAVGLEPAFLGDATATQTVDALLPLWFALVKLNGGDRKVALRIVR
jgi:predicted dinucleotide-binding enzyme